MMNKARAIIITLGLTSLPLLGNSAEMPKELHGSWILDAPATEEYLQASPKWKPEDAKYLPMIMKRMSQVLYTFKEASITVKMRSKEQALPISSVEREGDNFVFKGSARGKAVTLTVSFRKDGMINIRSSATNDMDYYIWKRGSLPTKEGPSDQSLVLDVVKEAMQEASNKPPPGDGK